MWLLLFEFRFELCTKQTFWLSILVIKPCITLNSVEKWYFFLFQKYHRNVTDLLCIFRNFQGSNTATPNLNMWWFTLFSPNKTRKKTSNFLNETCFLLFFERQLAWKASTNVNKQSLYYVQQFYFTNKKNENYHDFTLERCECTENDQRRRKKTHMRVKDDRNLKNMSEQEKNHDNFGWWEHVLS